MNHNETKAKRQPIFEPKMSLPVGLIGLILMIILFTGCSVNFETPVAAQGPQTTTPIISLDPTSGAVDTAITINGQGWPANSQVLFSATEPEQSEANGFALAAALADEAGQVTGTLILPAETAETAPRVLKIVARTTDGTVTAEAYFNLLPTVMEPTPTPTVVEMETATPTIEAPTATVEVPTATPQPLDPIVVANTDLNIRSGPGTVYTALGQLKAGQQADVTGVSPDRQWWQIRFNGVAGERGWVAAQYVTAQNVGGIVTVEPPPVPPTPTPQPVVITEWRGEYFNNLTLAGSAAVVRNDGDINFNWGQAAPVAGLSADNFSVRWSRDLNFSNGPYRFSVTADDGVRLWVDGKLLIDQWHDSSPQTYTADINLGDGGHTIKLEYYEHLADARIQLAWAKIESFNDWKGEYFNNPSVSGSPVLVRNDANVQFGWGAGSPGPGIQADGFSARWSRVMRLSAGRYRFSILVDDGVRLWVDGNLLIDQWHNSEPKTYTADFTVKEGNHDFRIDYFDDRYDAQIYFRWERIDGSSGGGSGPWKAEYYDNRKLDGKPILVQNESKVDYDWDKNAPAPGVPADKFSVRWTGWFDFDNATYLFKIKADDGVRIWLDNTLIYDDWVDGDARTVEVSEHLSKDRHLVRVEYYEHSGEAEVKVDWRKN